MNDLGHWKRDPDFPVEDWKYEVANDDTRLGYLDWVKHQRDALDDWSDATNYEIVMGLDN